MYHHTCKLRKCQCSFHVYLHLHIYGTLNTNLTNSEEFRCGFRYIATQQAAEHSWCVHGTSVLCPRNVLALSPNVHALRFRFVGWMVGPHASCTDCCIVLCWSYLVGGGGGCSCMLCCIPYWLALMLALTFAPALFCAVVNVSCSLVILLGIQCLPCIVFV